MKRNIDAVVAIANQCIADLHSINIYPNEVHEYVVNTRAKSRWGQCTKVADNTSNTFSISIASRLLEDDVSEQSLKNVIAHELLHTIEGCFNHGVTWKVLASKVNYLLGYRITREMSAEELGIKAEEPKPIVYKYKVTCNKCGATDLYQKAGRVVSQPNNYCCGKCGGTLKVEKL